MVRVGIPRALLYYQYYPMWRAFFEFLGAEVVTSPPTVKTMLVEGSARLVAETCLPVKVFMGHVLSLVEKCDYVFIPAIHSVEKRVHNCSKFLGLPDMTRAVIPTSPPILDMDIDVSKGKRELYQEIYRLGRRFTWNPLKLKEAVKTALEADKAYQTRMRHYKLTPVEAMKNELLPKSEKNGDFLTIGLIGHPYLVYDEYVNHRLVTRLEQMGARVLTSEFIGAEELEAAVAQVVGGSYWTYEKEVVGAGGYYLNNNADGVIGLIAFGCGPDSLMMDMVQRYALQCGKPFMALTLDEHTAGTGLVTCLEAFVDMVWRRKAKSRCV